MSSPSYLLGLALLYVGALFAVAWFTDRRSDRLARRSPRWRAAVYALSLGVYCSSWTFYGAVGSATDSPWSHAPIYLGPILVFLFGWPLLKRLVDVGTRHQVTSIADYLGARFGKRQSLSILVTCVAAAAVLPYIALQFRALTQAWLIVAGAAADAPLGRDDAGLAIAVVLAIFTLLFGARRMDAHERHRGMVTAVALESLVKLLAFMAVALLALAYLAPLAAATFDARAPAAPAFASLTLASPALSAFASSALSPSIWAAPAPFALSSDFVTRTLISACAIVCLPRQFHVMVVEAPKERGATRYARWLLPLYLAMFLFLPMPISLAGTALVDAAGVDHLAPDAYVQWLPAALGRPWIALAAFVGGLSAATGMVIVATVSLAIMMTNEVAAPAMIRSKTEAGSALLSLGNRLRRVRQIAIVAILLAAWLVSRYLHTIPWLSEIGFMSFLAASQLAPGVLAGLYWPRAHGLAVMLGLAAGLALWFYCLVLPELLPASSALRGAGPFGLAALKPQSLLGWAGPDPLTYAALWSLGVNSALLIGLSLVFRIDAVDRRQAAVFLNGRRGVAADGDLDLSPVRAGQVRALLPPFLGDSRIQELWRSFEARYQQRLLPADRVPMFVVRQCEQALAGVIGAASANRIMTELSDNRQIGFNELATIVSRVGRQQTFNRELLEYTIESMLQGVAVVDRELRLVAWNSRYEQMFAYPSRLLYVGMPVERLFRHNAERGVIAVGKSSIEAEVEKRLAWLRKRQAHRFERTLPDGRVLDIHGVPMPRGGIVITYTDVSDYREMVTQLEEARLELEDRVASGSQSLAEANAQLRRENRLRAEAEAKLRETALSKSRFMSATSHDLLQPITAARLFVAALRTQVPAADDAVDTLEKIDLSLRRAEGLLSELREIARLDSGTQQPQPAPFALDALLRELYAACLPAAQGKGLELRLRSSALWLHGDRALIYRALQNLLGNAIKYTRRGRVLIGARRRPGRVELQILDQGPGIAVADRSRVFEEFERAGARVDEDGEEGLGLGLAIVRRLARLLKHPLRLHSEPGRGSLFALSVPRAQPLANELHDRSEAQAPGRLHGVRVLCLDNDARVRDALAVVLESQGCRVMALGERRGLREALAGFRPDVVLADYHLDDGDNGIAALAWARGGADRHRPGIIISADNSRAVREAARKAGYRYLPKPVNPHRLSALIAALTAPRTAITASAATIT